MRESPVRRPGVDADSPWPGLTAFGEADSGFFYGRDAEAAALFEMVDRERVTILLGQSGLGKTSLLCAGLFPRLRHKDILPVSIRLRFDDDRHSCREQVVDALATAAGEADVEMPAALPGGTLWEMFHHRDAAFWNRDNRLVTPLLVFDQFEEVFTSAGEHLADLRAFLGELAALAEGRPVPSVRERLESSLEEFSQYSFLTQACKILLSLREDYLAELDSVADGFGAIVGNRFRLRPLKGPAALDVVCRPSPGLIAPDVVADIVRFVAGAPENRALADLDVQPALLSLFCLELNRQRIQRALPTVTRDLVAGSSAGIFRDFYERSLEDVRPEVRRFVEEQLVAESGHRRAVTLNAALTMPGVDRQSLDSLIERRVLRVELSGHIQQIELTHDVLAAQLQASQHDRREFARQHLMVQPLTAAVESDHHAPATSPIRRLVLWNRILTVTVVVLLAIVAFLLARRH